MKKMEKEKKCPSSEGHLFWEGGRLCFCTFPYRSALCSFHRDWLLTECGHLEIFVKVIYQETNQTITLAVDPDDSIAHLKSVINAKKGFPVDEQRIVYNGRKLRDDRTVSDYNIPNKSTLNLVLRVPGRHNGHNRMEVTILTEARGPVATYTLAVRPTDSILEVKLKIRDMTGVPPQKQILNFADRELENTRIISDYNIRNDSVIYLVEKIEVCLVFSSTQERMALELSPKDTVESVKEKIHAKTKISPYRQILQFNGEHLDDVHSLNYYNIENKSMLFLYLAVEIFVKMSTGIDVRFKLIKSNTIKNLKERIQLSQDIPCDMQRLYFLRRLLEDKYALSDYSIKNGSVLDCNVLLISVNVKMPNKDDISVDVCPEDKVRIVIDKIQAREAIPPDHQCLMYNGIKLAHCRTLRDYHIRNGSILNLVKFGGGRTFDALRQIERETKQLIRTTKLQSNLETIAHEKGFTISENEGGGNCMFIALSEQLGQAKGIKISHKELRQRVVQYLKENPKTRDGEELFHFVHGYQSWDAYLKGMKADGTWGDHVILHGAANCFEMCVHVISSLGHDSDVMICEEFDVTGSKRLVLGHVAELHYVSLFPHKGVASSRLEIFIKVSSQETFTLEVDSNDFIRNLKNKIEDKKGFPVETQRISYGGKELNDDRTVRDYNIQNQSILNLIPPGVEIECRVGFVTESPSTQDMMNRVADWYLQTMKPSNREELNEFIEYLEKFRNVIVVGVKTGSLIFTLSCGSVQILDKLWKDYKTGRLNEIAQSYLVTNDVLREFGLSSLKLTSNIKEEDYRACRLRLSTIEVTNQTLGSLRAAFLRWISIRRHTKRMLESLVRDLLGEYDTATGNTVGFVMGAGAVLAAPFTFGASLVAAAAVGGIGALIGAEVEKRFRLPFVQLAIERDRTACIELQRKLISLNRTFTSTASAGALIRTVSHFANASGLPWDISELVKSSLDRHHGSTSPIVREIRRILNNLKCPDETEIERLV